LCCPIDENITLSNVGSNKIVIAGKEFLLTGINGALTDLHIITNGIVNPRITYILIVLINVKHTTICRQGVAGKEFLLTGINGALTKTLEFAYTVQLNDKIDAAY
jgi:hypothetical protein